MKKATQNDQQAVEDDYSSMDAATKSRSSHAVDASASPPNYSSIYISRSSYKSDVESNDNLPDDKNASSVPYTGKTKHGVVHIVDSTSKRPPLHLWLGILQLWPVSVDTFRKKGYDTILFTPYSSGENWAKAYPEMIIAAVIKPKGQGSKSKKANFEDGDGGILNAFMNIMFSGSYPIIAVKVILFVGTIVLTAMIGHTIGYRYEAKRHAAAKKPDRLSSYAYKPLIEREQQCIAIDNNDMLGLREKTEKLFSGNKKTDEQHSEALLSWLEEEGGYFHPNVEIRRVDSSDPTSYFGLFAKDFIPEGDVLLRVPRGMVLDSTEEFVESHEIMNCGTVRNLIDQLKLKDESKYAPYVNYLMDTQPPGIPSAWSKAGKDLLARITEPPDSFSVVDRWFPIQWSVVVKELLSILTGQPYIRFHLPPYNPSNWLWLDEWYETCEGSNDPLEEYAALTVVQRSWDELLIPVFDKLSHRNGPWLNTAHSDVFDRDIDVEVKASRDIKTNEQLYTSYNECENCSNRKYEFGVERILTEYGFVEEMPQSFYFHHLKFGYRLEENWKTIAKNSGYGKPYVTEWVYKEPSKENVAEMELMLKQISWRKATELSKQCSVPDHEWDTINNYFDALEKGLKAAIKGVRQKRSNKQKIEVIGLDDSSDDDSSDD